MSYVIPEDTENIYGCGYAWLSPSHFEEDMAPDLLSKATIASFFGMDADGDLKFVFQLGDNKLAQHGICRSISHDSKTNDLVAVLETNTVVLRPDYERYSSSGALDTLIVRFTTNGKFQNAYNINNDRGAQTIDLSYHSGLSIDNQFIFGA